MSKEITNFITSPTFIISVALFLVCVVIGFFGDIYLRKKQRMRKKVKDEILEKTDSASNTSEVNKDVSSEIDNALNNYSQNINQNNNTINNQNQSILVDPVNDLVMPMGSEQTNQNSFPQQNVQEPPKHVSFSETLPEENNYNNMF